MIKSDRWIRKMCEEKGMITPFFSESVKVLNGKKVPSFGLSSYGYDIRMSTTVKVFRSLEKSYVTVNGVRTLIEPIWPDSIVSFNNESYEKQYPAMKLTEGADHSKFYQTFENVDTIVIPPNGFILANTMEHFNIPERTTGVCIGKSSLARMGCHPLVTPLEVLWSGYLTLELKNLNTVPIELQTQCGIAQVQFFESDEDCEVSYADRGGKYMNQGNVPIDGKV